MLLNLYLEAMQAGSAKGAGNPPAMGGISAAPSAVPRLEVAS